MSTLHHLLFSFRRCPYAMRARMALLVSGIPVQIQEVQLSKKPPELLAVSPKGTVPVLITTESQILDESIDIMKWCLHQNDPKHWLHTQGEESAVSLVEKNDSEFKKYLDYYKYAERFPDRSEWEDRTQAERFLQVLEDRLKSQLFLFANHETWVDIAVFPFVRQFSMVDPTWFESSSYERVRKWLNSFLVANEFQFIMKKGLVKIA